ncbi:helix-turn-helix domain-containing protein [Enterobacter asburiae]|uniref:helix-turn-helix domain-containing protein n=1 Tax=Enterobacter asburiae TaxID=61645 RepID=UPI000794B356|nr:helix-turn-helix domain-containing protein [Enterobacter asburiae]MDL4614298.1 helix-turn-helix domain-containing protein [Enterobacter asburiae]SAG78665.1 cAMP-binding proteins-catabolite gene activator and regulatory subunit of cAMP-dependent protein kinases [Enterobacter cloacae]
MNMMISYQELVRTFPKISPSLLFRTSESGQQLIDYLKHGGETKSILPRRRLSLCVGNDRLCYVILKGSVIAHRHSDDLAVLTLTGPALIGVGNLLTVELDGYIKTLTRCDMVILNMDTVHEMINTQQLWDLVAKHMMLISGMLYHHSELLTAPSAYGVVRQQLYELINEHPTIRNNITAERYIRDKTLLSRSGVMRILSGLKEGGYIELHRGILTRVSSLPEKF